MVNNTQKHKKCSSDSDSDSDSDEGEKPLPQLSFLENFENRVLNGYLPFVFAKSNEIRDDEKGYSFCGEGPIEAICLSMEEKLIVSVIEFVHSSTYRDGIRPHFDSKREDAAKSIGVRVSTFKHISRHHVIQNLTVPALSHPSPKGPAATILDTEPTTAHTVPHLKTWQDVMSMTLKVAYRKKIIKFPLPRTSGIIELKKEVSKRLKLQLCNFEVEYKDDEGDWIIINCNEDLRNYLQLFRSTGNRVIRLRAVDSDACRTNLI